MSLTIAHGLERGLKESLNRAWTYLQSVSERMGLAETLRHKDVVAEAIDLSGGRVECACGVAFFAAILSALNARRVQAGTVVLGDLTIQGNVKALTSITEVLQLSLDNGALPHTRRATARTAHPTLSRRGAPLPPGAAPRTPPAAPRAAW